MTCKTHPDAPHGFVRGAGHSEDRYVCECEFWEEPKMNERTRQLAGQALDRVVPYTWTRLDYDEIQKLQEYFAELIVRECIRECKQEWYDTNNDPELNAETDTRMIGIKIGIKQGSLKCISRIKEHFGVEE